MKIEINHKLAALDPDGEYTEDQIDLIYHAAVDEIDRAVLSEFPAATILHVRSDEPTVILAQNEDDARRAQQILEDVCDRGAFFAAGCGDGTPVAEGTPVVTPVVTPVEPPADTVYRMASTPWCHTPGLVRWVAEAVLPFDPGKARELLSGLGLPDDAVAAIIDGTAKLTTGEGETLVVTIPATTR